MEDNFKSIKILKTILQLPFHVVHIIALIERDGKFLAIKKERILENGKKVVYYSFPGGLLYHDESPLECIKREVKQEVGIEIEPIRLITFNKYRHPFSGTYDVSIFVLCKPKSLDIKLGREVDQRFIEAVWIDENTKDIPEWMREAIIQAKENTLSLDFIGKIW